MTATIVFTDVEGAVREWLRAHPLLTPLLGSGNNARIFFGIPTGISFPFVTVSRVGGGPHEGLAPLDVARLSFEVWGSTKKTAQDVVVALTSAVEQLETEPLNASVKGEGAHVDMILWRPDPTDGRPRYIVDVTITASIIPDDEA